MNVYSICEIGVNHLGSYDKALRMVHKAKEVGASAVKFQLYKPEEVLGKDSPYLKDAHQLDIKELSQLSEITHSLSMDFGCSVFNVVDIPIVDTLVDFHKIATRMNKDRSFIDAIKEKGKPVYMSIQAQPHYEGPLVKYLWCVAKYPSTKEEVLGYAFNSDFGVSSHCPDWRVTYAAYFNGARVIENHVKEFDTDEGCDMSSSLNFEDYKRLLNEIKH